MMSIDEVVSNTRKPHQAKQEDNRRKSGLVNKRGPGVQGSWLFWHKTNYPILCWTSDQRWPLLPWTAAATVCNYSGDVSRSVIIIVGQRCRGRPVHRWSVDDEDIGRRCRHHESLSPSLSLAGFYTGLLESTLGYGKTCVRHISVCSVVEQLNIPLRLQLCTGFEEEYASKVPRGALKKTSDSAVFLQVKSGTARWATSPPGVYTQSALLKPHRLTSFYRNL